MTQNSAVFLAICGISTLSGCAQTATPARFASATPKAVCPGGTVSNDGELAAYAGCESISGDFTLQGISTLTTLAELQRVDGELKITNTRAESLAGLDRLQSAKSIQIDSNARLSDISAIGALHSVNHVIFRGNPRLTSPSGFAPVSTLDGLEIDNSGFTSLTGLESLRYVRSLTITNNQRLISVRSLRYVTHIDELILERNGRICAQLGFFGGLRQAPKTSIVRHNPTVFDSEIAKLKSGPRLSETASRP